MSRTLRVGLDLSAAAVAEPTGVAAAIRRAVEALRQHEGVSPIGFLRLSRFRRRHHIADLSIPRRWLVDGAFPLLGVDLFHGPDTRLPRTQRVPLVSTIHDFSALQEGGFSGARFRATRQAHYQDARARAKRIVVYSEAIRSEVVKRLSLPRERVDLVPLAPALAAQPELSRRRDPFVLCLGELSVRKNSAGAIEAFRIAQERGSLKGWRLLMAGRPGHGAEAIIGLADQTPGVERLGYLSAARLAGLLEEAQVLLFPSRYEGFGLPVLEAMIRDLPVVTSEAPALVELVGDAALHAPAEDHEGLAAQLMALAADEGLRQRLIEAGRRRVADYSWERSAAALVRCYEGALAPPEPLR